MNSLNLKESDFMVKNNIKYILINKLNDFIIITNIDNYFKSNIYKNLCKYSGLTKIKIENNTYIPELFIDSYCSWYSSIYYINKFKVNNSFAEDSVKNDDNKKLEFSSENEELETLKDILKSVISIKTDLASIHTYIYKFNYAKNLNLNNNFEQFSKESIKNGIKTVKHKITELKDDILDIPVKSENVND